MGVGETTLFAVDENDNVLMSALIKVTHNTGALQDGIAAVAPGQSVQATTVDQSLVLTGTVADAEQAANVMQVATQFVDDPRGWSTASNIAAPTQVNLQVRIAEVGRNVDRRLGIRWGALGINSTGSTRWGFVGGAGVPEGYGASIGYSGPSLNVDVVLEALSEEGLVTILAEPNLTARSGEPASFLAGGEYPYSVVNDDENTIEFKDFGIGLNFTPTVLDGSRISLKVATEVSELDFAARRLGAQPDPVAEDPPRRDHGRSRQRPELRHRRADAELVLAEHRAGCRRSGTIPVLGALFRSNNFQRGQTELVIIVTPVIVGPTVEPAPRRHPGRHLRAAERLRAHPARAASRATAGKVSRSGTAWAAAG